MAVAFILLTYAFYLTAQAPGTPDFVVQESPFRQSINLIRTVEKSYVGQHAICSSLYGQKFVDGLIREPICVPPRVAATDRISSLMCASRPLPKVLKSHGEKSTELRLCIMENAMISPMNDVPFRFMYPANCIKPATNYRTHNYGHCDKGLFPSFCKFTNNTPPLQPTETQKCEHYVNHTVLWLARGGIQIYHSFIEDYFAMAYFAMLVADEDPKDSQIMIVDMYGRSYKTDAERLKNHIISHEEFEFNLLFGKNYSVPQQLKPNTCFKKSIFSLGPWYLPYQSKCPSAFAYGFRHWIMATLNLTYPVEKTKRIVYFSRGSDATKDPKQWKQEENFLRHVRSRQLPEGWVFEVLTPGKGTENYIDFLHHKRLVYNATIIVAPHGSHMVHILWTQPETHFIEIKYEGRSWNVFRDLAHSLGLKYSFWSSNVKKDESHDIERLILDAIANIDKPAKPLYIDQRLESYHYGIAKRRNV
jgi:hypothetical protein